MAHPLNYPRVDPLNRIVKSGYAILQPRVTIHLQNTEASLFTRLFSDDFGIDPYTKSVSDVYQDLFGEGAFIGKGIYDIDAFSKTLEYRFPENRILSHDLIESGFARSGLVSDIQIVEEYPEGYNVEAGRRHRWIRGDWQIASWIFASVPSENDLFALNPLSGLSRWKIFDNLRRSLSPVATVGALLLSWSLNSNATHVVTLWLIIYLFLPYLIQALNFKLFSHTPTKSYRQIGREQAQLLFRAICLLILTVAFLAYDAYLATDATFRSLYRLVISKSNLLQWQTAAESHRTASHKPFAYLKLMWFAPTAALTGLMLIINHLDDESIWPFIICVGWLVSPLVAWWISQPLHRKATNLAPSQYIFLRALARRTWLFFETFVTEGDHWLPPDNVQEFPSETIAHRTSPTNIGLGLLSTLGAFDFGYMSLNSFIRRVEDTLSTLEKMERFKGHFYNWYDTQTLAPLSPHYISTVDSGNLAGSLLALRQGLNQIADGSLWIDHLWEGIEDTLFVIHQLVSSEKSLSVPLQNKISELLNTLSGFIEKRKIESNTSTSETIQRLDEIQEKIKQMVEFVTEGLDLEVNRWIERLTNQINDHRSFLNFLTSENKNVLLEKLRNLADRATAMMNQDYLFLYNPENKLLTIGYHVIDSRLDQAYYDLLASEARLASFLAIADGSLPQEHWFALGRQLTTVNGSRTLMSWSGSMFEYLMPLLILPSYEGTLLDESCRQCVRHQIQYGKDRNVPWGISESGYNITDAQYNYQYRAFGVPGLGFKRGLELDLVIAPYASAMALMLDPKAACLNLEAIIKAGYSGKFGLYEAIDFTPSRLPAGKDHVIIKSFMAHHQGMAFLSLLHFLLDKPMQRRIENDPNFRATELLLYERMPKGTAVVQEVFVAADSASTPALEANTFRILKDPNAPTPDVHLLGNERYHVMVTSAGSGYSFWKNLMVTRWREDRTRDSYGYFIYLKDHENSKTWSAAYQPLLTKVDAYEVLFSEGRAEIKGSRDGLDSHLEIAVSPDDDTELRRVSIFNHGKQKKIIEITTYAEVVLAPASDDIAHPAFSNLFVETEVFGDQKGILCRRRARDGTQNNPWLYHAVVVHGVESEAAGIETDRTQFVGRNRDPSHPAAMVNKLVNSAGPVLDPIISIRKIITIPPGNTAVIDCFLGISEEREGAIACIERFADKQIADRVLELSWTHGHVLLCQLNCSAEDAVLYGKMAGHLIYGAGTLRAQSLLIKSNSKPLSALWNYGISGDLPIILLRFQNQDNLKLLKLLVKGHDYWRRKGLIVDLVIWNESTPGYRQDLHDKILEVIAASSSVPLLDKNGGIFIRRPDQMPAEDRVVFQSAARIILSDQDGSLEDQISSTRNADLPLPKALLLRPIDKIAPLLHDPSFEVASANNDDGLIDNGLGSFSQNGKEYRIRLEPGKHTPMPWVNVLSNPNFGTLVSESGSSYTWSENAHENRLTPWFNDPVSDPTGEALFIRDQATGESWSPTIGPRPANAHYDVCHGFGYSSFSTTTHGISSKMFVFVEKNDPVKFILLKLTNQSSRKRRLSITSYFELVLGDVRAKASSLINTEADPQSAIYARNLFASDFRGQVAFLGSTEPVSSFTGDRTEFIGRNRSLASPSAMDRIGLSGRLVAIFDPCLAIQISCEIDPGATKELAFTFGIGSDFSGARKLVQQYRSVASVQMALANVRQFWSNLLQKIQIETPDQSLNFLANGWLLYQTIASRIWGRTGFYQSGGAYGFRDQLQDMMAVVYAAPEIVRAHILKCASRQFPEGDVQHWWHPPQGRGVRTTISDDYLWLPHVVDHYIKVTGDFGILDECVHYLNAKLLSYGEESDYSMPGVSEEQDSIYNHCVKALKHGLKFGVHGLPLMGSGDWNDGMNQIGIHGKGESVWLAFFLFDILQKFSTLADQRGDQDFATQCRDKADWLKIKIDENGWDGDWYLRAFFDDGTPLGTSSDQECRIDSLPQSWSVLSGAGSKSRAVKGMESVYQKLVLRDKRIIKLFDPPFDKQRPNPGYISGYLPGVRENGGQYTHAALWVIFAFVRLGDMDRALELLNLINPVHHSDSPEAVSRYKVEPYVIAADIYSTEPHCGRGGWTWYTGSAAWFYRAILEMFLGFDLRGDKLYLDPHLPTTWQGYKLTFFYRQTPYKIEVLRSEVAKGVLTMTVDGREVTGFIHLADDRTEHVIKVNLAIM